jgi:hypothetical protein
MFQESDYSTGKSIIMAIVILNSFKSWFGDAFSSIHTNYVKVVFWQNLSGFNIKWMIKA